MTIERETPSIFRTLVESIPHGLVLVNPQAQIVLVNGGTEQMFGYSRAELLHASVHTLLPDLSSAPHHDIFQACAHAPRGPDQALHARRKDGSTFPVELDLAPLDGQGSPLWLATLVDITARQRLDELERRNREIDEFTDAISHDLRSPLRAVFNLTQFIEEDVLGSADPRLHGYIDGIKERITTMDRMLSDLLTYTRILRHDGSDDPISASDLIALVLEPLVIPPAFTVEVSGESWLQLRSRIPLEQVLRNLVHNAVGHHDRPDGRVRIEISRAGPSRAEIVVEDDGPGIDPRHHERIFRIFETLGTRTGEQGTGMGLALVQRIVEKHEGRIALASSPGSGARLSFTWPLAEAELSAETTEHPA